MENERLDERMADIEMKLMHLETQIEDMNTVVIEQAEVITYLKAKVKVAEGRIDTLSHDLEEERGLSSIEKLAQEKPPHY